MRAPVPVDATAAETFAHSPVPVRKMTMGDEGLGEVSSSSSSGLVLYGQTTAKAYPYAGAGHSVAGHGGSAAPATAAATSSTLAKNSTAKMLSGFGGHHGHVHHHSAHQHQHHHHHHHGLSHGHRHGPAGGVVGSRNPVMAPVAPSFTVLTGIANVGLAGLTGSPDHSLPSSDIGEVDLDLWDLDINAPSASPSSGGHSPAAPLPGRRSSDTSSTSG